MYVLTYIEAINQVTNLVKALMSYVLTPNELRWLKLACTIKFGQMTRIAMKTKRDTNVV